MFRAAFFIIMALIMGCQAEAMGRFSGVLQVRYMGGALPEPPSATCTDGSDCLCDTVTAGAGDSILFCEDFQDPALYSGVTNNWVYAAASNRERGQDSRWTLEYGLGSQAMWTQGQPVAEPRQGKMCDVLGGSFCNAQYEYCSTNQGNLVDGQGADCWQANGFGPQVDIQGPGDSGERLPGQSDPAGSFNSQDRWFAQTPNPTFPGGIIGTATWTSTTDIGITQASAYPTNLVSSGVLDNPWKHNEWGPSNKSALVGFSSSPIGLTDEFPYQGFITPDDSCGTSGPGLLAGITVGAETGTLIGEEFKCDSRFRWHADTTLYDQSTDWPLGTWGCTQTKITGMGTSDTCVTQWHNGEVIVDFCGLDTTSTDLKSGLDRFSWNAYANAWQTDPQNLTDATARYHDNVVITDGDPVSCNDVGFSISPPPVTSCTDGVDCRCDSLVTTYGSDIVFCEDFENPRLTEKGVWQKNPSSLVGAGWEDQGYTGISAGCGFADDNGGIPTGSSLFGAAQLVNVGRCIEINDAERQSAIPGISAVQVFDGGHSMAVLNQPANAYPELPPVDGEPDYQPGGKHGLAVLSETVNNFGITRAHLVTSNVNKTGVAWKDDQFTGNDMGFWGTVNPLTCPDTGVTAGGWNDYPYAGTIWNPTSTVAKTDVQGNSCYTTKLKMWTDGSEGAFPEDQWVCQQIQYENWGTDTMRVRHWEDGVLVLDVQDIGASNMVGSINPAGLDTFNWNNYFNGFPASNNQGYEGTEYSGRLKDNVVIKKGAPVPCSEIGF